MTKGTVLIPCFYVYLYHMKKYITLISLLVIVVTTHAQGLLEEKYDDCNSKDTCLYCGDKKAHFHQKLTDYFKWQIEHAVHGYDMKSGDIFYEVVIDTNGHSCVLSVKNRGNNWDMKNDIRSWINQMEGWVPAQKNGNKIASTVLLDFQFRVNWMSVHYVQPEDVLPGKD